MGSETEKNVHSCPSDDKIVCILIAAQFMDEGAMFHGRAGLSY
jgi:hypothetical protein